MGAYNFGNWNSQLNNFEQPGYDNDLYRAVGHFANRTEATWLIEDNAMNLATEIINSPLPFNLNMVATFLQQYLISKNIILDDFKIDFTGENKKLGVIKVTFSKNNNSITTGA